MTGATSLWKKQLIILALLIGARCLGMVAFSDEDIKSGKPVPLRLPTTIGSATIGSWKGKDVKIDPFVYTELHPDAVLQKRYKLKNPNEQPAHIGSTSSPTEVEVLVMYSRDTFGFHPPDVCLKMQGWEITKSEIRLLASKDNSLAINVVTSQQHEQTRQIAYCFTDSSGEISGRVGAFANMILARVLRRRVGTLELQYAYNRSALLPNGDFTPQLKDLILKTAKTIHQQLANETA